jgi:SAM-dependent methyltransferase
MKAGDSAWYASCWLYGLRGSKGVPAGSEGRIGWNFAQALSVLRGAEGKKLLDVGCAEGHFLNLARELGCEITGVDFNPVIVEIARKLLGASTDSQGHSLMWLRFSRFLNIPPTRIKRCVPFMGY